jgi:hypothetical protein
LDLFDKGYYTMIRHFFEVTGRTFGPAKNRFHKMVKNGLAEPQSPCALHQLMEIKAEKSEKEKRGFAWANKGRDIRNWREIRGQRSKQRKKLPSLAG